MKNGKQIPEKIAALPVFDEESQERIGYVSIATHYTDLLEHDRWYRSDNEVYTKIDLLGTTLVVPLDAVLHARSYTGMILCDHVLRQDCPHSMDGNDPELH